MGYEFLVNSSVLIPRFDTEVLVEETIKHIMPGCRLLDVCTGSGCILLSLLEECKGRISAATGVDISKDALQVAIANRNRMGLTADFRESDLFSDVEGVYDVIVSNPPYIATKELEGMSRYWHLTEWKTGYIFTGKLWRRQVNIWNREDGSALRSDMIRERH